MATYIQSKLKNPTDITGTWVSRVACLCPHTSYTREWWLLWNKWMIWLLSEKTTTTFSMWRQLKQSTMQKGETFTIINFSKTFSFSTKLKLINSTWWLLRHGTNSPSSSAQQKSFKEQNFLYGIVPKICLYELILYKSRPSLYIHPLGVVKGTDFYLSKEILDFLSLNARWSFIQCRYEPKK